MLTKREHIINRKIILLKSRRSQKKIVEKLGLSRQYFFMLITGARSCAKTQKKICRIIRVKKEIFWPEFFPNGNDPVSHADTIDGGATPVN
jgi:hypothetical protein